MNPLPNPANGTVDIEYVVEEKSSDQIELSGGYGGAGPTTSGRIIGTLGLTFNNFSTKNFFKKSLSPLPGRRWTATFHPCTVKWTFLSGIQFFIYRAMAWK